MYQINRFCRLYAAVFMGILALCLSGPGLAQTTDSLEGQALYDGLKNFELQDTASVSNLTLKRDRGEMTFSGDFYFAAPVNGQVTGAVFIGQGTFHAEAPPMEYEKDYLKRFLDSDVVESDFKTAVLRFTDDTFEMIGSASTQAGEIPDQALDLAKDLEPRLLEETGINVSARLALSIENNESPGVFLAQFDKGKLDRFTFVLDPQTRILTSIFGINGGEKVAIFKYASYAYTNDIWIATYAEDDYEKGQVNYSDEFDIVNPLHYEMEIDLTNPRKVLKTKMRIDFESLVDNLRAVPMIVNDGLSAYDDKRLDESMKVQSAQYNGQDIPCVQEDWEVGLTFLLPKPMKKGEKFSVDVALDGDFIDNQQTLQNFHYPQSNSSWYPRHGFLKRSTFDLVFRHDKDHKVASIGKLIREEKWPDDSKDGLTEYQMNDPVSFATFGVGRLERHTETRELEFGTMDLNFYSFITGVNIETVKEEFVLAELGNTLNFFSALFGPYPYEDFQAVVHPFSFGQGFPTLLLIAPADEANREVFSFISHEASHQWWGNLVAWRSYRDQWLSEGFAEYSGLLYTLRRDSFYSMKEIMKEKRHDLEDPPVTDTGIGKGKAVEIGPLILGRRLNSRLSRNAYQLLTYDKGCFVLRMLHYLFSDPSTGDDQRFYAMLKDFVSRFANKHASTDDFIAVASAHFGQSPIGQAFGLKDLRWFFNQWVYQSYMPNYRMEYKLSSGEGNQTIVSGKIIQENAGPNWFMPIPVVLKFPGDQKAQMMVYANGPETDFSMPLPMKPDSVEMDPDMWILCDKMETKKK